jgi:hypothetical protein
MNSAFRKALAINEVGSLDTILKRFSLTVGMNEGNNEALTKTLKSTSQMPVTGETDEIIIDLSDGKNIYVTEFNRSYFELYFNINIDVFQGRFPILPTLMIYFHFRILVISYLVYLEISSCIFVFHLMLLYGVQCLLKNQFVSVY